MHDIRKRLKQLEQTMRPERGGCWLCRDVGNLLLRPEGNGYAAKSDDSESLWPIDPATGQVTCRCCGEAVPGAIVLPADVNEADLIRTVGWDGGLLLVNTGYDRA